jgi:amino acid transporter/nucleotide-binding universal stress UspA family protein
LGVAAGNRIGRPFVMKKFTAEVHLSREMTLTDATMIGVGAMIGAGIFVLTGIAAGIAGPALLVCFLLNGFVALLTAMSYAELGSCFHDAGGGYLWVKEGLPKWNGFLSGWMSWFAHAVACSLYALGFGAYFELVLRELGFNLPDIGILTPQKLLAVAAALLFAYINYRGASETGKIGNLVTITKIVILAIFVAFGLSLMLKRGDWTAAMTPFAPHGWAGIVKAMGLTFIAFQGFEVISQCSEEVKNPRRNIPRAVFLSLAIVVPIYLLVAVTSLGAVEPGRLTPWDYLAEKKETALVDVARTFFAGGGVMLLFGGIISTMSALNATIYSSSRVAFAMGRDRNFPNFFGKVHRRRFTPYLAILFSLGIVVLMSVSLRIEDVASAADIMFLLLFLQVNITLIRLRKKRPDLDRGFRVPFVPVLTFVGIGLLLFLAIYMVTYSPLGWLVTAGWIGIGLVVYRTYAFRREIAHVRFTKALERLERREYRILASLSNPASVRGLASIAQAIAKRHDAEVILLHVIEVEEGLPLRAGLEREEEIDPVFEEAERPLREAGIPVRSLVRVSHRISQGILETANEENCNFIILGREKRQSFLEKIYSSVVDSVIRESPCEVAVLHGRLREQGVRSLLIPFGENVHTLLAVEVAPALVEQWRCRARVVVVREPGTSLTAIEERLAKVREAMSAANLKAGLEIIPDKGIVEGIAQLSRRADLVLMGGRNADFLGLLFANSLTQEITERVACPVLWVKEYEEIPSFWESLLRSEPSEVEQKP